LKVEEFSLGPLSQYVKGMSEAFWNPNEPVAMNLVCALVEVMESKKPRCVKACTDILKELKTKLGTTENMLACMTEALVKKMRQSLGATSAQSEESKEGEMDQKAE
jgi:hypothetical protein